MTNPFNDLRTLLKEDDKRMHFACGVMFGLVSLVLAVAAGFAKEVRDVYKGGCFDWRDLRATVYGGIIGRTVSIVASLVCLLL